MERDTGWREGEWREEWRGWRGRDGGEGTAGASRPGCTLHWRRCTSNRVVAADSSPRRPAAAREASREARPCMEGGEEGGDGGDGEGEDREGGGGQGGQARPCMRLQCMAWRARGRGSGTASSSEDASPPKSPPKARQKAGPEGVHLTWIMKNPERDRW